MRHYNIPIFITHFGCPNKCVFCNQNKITGRETNIEPEEIKEIVEEYLLTLPSSAKKEISFFGGTFTAISLPLQVKFLEEAKYFIDNGNVTGIRLSTRPDNLTKENVEILKKYGVTTVELGVQSLDDKVLKISERGYKKEEVERAVNLLRLYEIEVGIQIMPGLPGSSFKSDLETVEEIIKMKPDLARIYPTLVINDTKLEKMYRENKYRVMELEEAIKISSRMIAMLELNNIKIIRVGLQPSEDIREEGVIVAGPFHPAFRDLCESYIYKVFFEKMLLDKEKLEIIISKKEISRVVGIKKSNVHYFKDKIAIKEDSYLSRESFYLNGESFKREDLLKNILRVVLNETDYYKC
jgi:histone acetyltransferase (RNA polymerase elongator complex component)